MILWATRVYFWAQRKAARKSIDLEKLCCLLLDTEVRALKDDLLQFGEDEKLDCIVECVARQLMGRELSAAHDEVKGDHLVAELLRLASASEEVKAVVGRYHAARAYLPGLLKDETTKTEQLALAKKAVPKIEEFGEQEIFREHKRTAARLKTISKEVAERLAIKADVTMASLASGVGLLSAVFVFTGYLYVRFFYEQMGIDASLYFSIGDYLASSIEQVRSGAVFAALTLVGFAYGVRERSLKPRLYYMVAAPARRLERRFYLAIVLGTGIVFGYSVYKGDPNFFLLHFLSVSVSFFVGDRIAVAYFKNYLAALAVIVGLSVFTANVMISAYKRSEDILAGRTSSASMQKVRFKDATLQIKGELFGANSAYLFFYSRDDGATIIVPRDSVQQIEIVKPGP